MELFIKPNSINFKNVKHVLLDHDGTISTLRQGWEDIMRKVMLEVIIGDKRGHIKTTLYNKIKNRVDKYIDESTGIQTILQMEELVEIVKEFGLIPEDKVLDKFSYKKIYNGELMKIVNQRKEKIRRKESSVEDFTIKGAVNFLKTINESDIKLYLASGTDREDTIEDATVLGYADIFKDRIYGALGDIKKYSKKIIIKMILRENKLSGNQLMVIGDGPVEMIECRRNKGIAVGVASDEIRRCGINMKKRERLIKSGAQIIIPDFSEADELIRLVFNRSC